MNRHYFSKHIKAVCALSIAAALALTGCGSETAAQKARRKLLPKHLTLQQLPQKLLPLLREAPPKHLPKMILTGNSPTI